MFQSNSPVFDTNADNNRDLTTSPKCATESSSSIEIVGLFMKNLFEYNSSLETEGLAQRYGSNFQAEHDILVAKQYDQRKLIHLIISIYNGIPEHFDILRCCSTTTKHDLDSFMRRVLLMPRLYVILEVNCLSFELQEVRRNMLFSKLLKLVWSNV